MGTSPLAQPIFRLQQSQPRSSLERQARHLPCNAASDIITCLMKVLRHNQSDFEAAINTALAVNSLFDIGIEDRGHAIINDTQVCGDAAVIHLSR